MAYVKRIVCLANSAKIGGSCVAGREILEDGALSSWVRPVSARPYGALSFMESLYENNDSPELMDIIDVPLQRLAPLHHQTENEVIDTSKTWVKQGVLPYGVLATLCQHPQTLWTNSDRTCHGLYNCMSQTEALAFTTSLLLIELRKLIVSVGTSSASGKSRQTFQSVFMYNGVKHSLNLTDPKAVSTFGKRGLGDYALSDVYLCISLTEPWAKDNNRCHKIVAAILSSKPL